ncbi:MAG: hypothetical protein IPO08_19985 [Xanthomonadales bacterium]|nr:hypothetical protein [Xanthomonadales bacterium]
MSWVAKQRAEVTPGDLYELAASHRLMPRDMVSAIQSYKAMAGVVKWWDLSTEEGKHVADLLITPSICGIAQVDLVPKPEFFAPSADFQDDLKAAVSEILAATFGGDLSIRKLEAEVPVSRGRTKKALIALGFRHEGRRSIGVQFYGCEPEDTFLLGLLNDKGARHG